MLPFWGVVINRRSLINSCLRPKLVIFLKMRVFPVDDHGLFWVDKFSYELMAVFDV